MSLNQNPMYHILCIKYMSLNINRSNYFAKYYPFEIEQLGLIDTHLTQ